MIGTRRAAADTGSEAMHRPRGGGDRISHPPPREEFTTPDGRHRLVIASVDSQGWSSRRSTAQMQRHSDAGWQTLWRLNLPHAYRPRFAIATPQGGAVLLDEWINISSPLAIMVIDGEGRPISQMPLSAVLPLLGMPPDQVVRIARFGLWLQSGPSLSADGRFVEVRTADRRLRIRIADGALEVV